jgi:hypothetical protein
MQLAEMKDQVEVDDFVNLLTKVVDVQLPERKELLEDDKVATGDTADGLEDSFRARVIREFPSLCADSLPHDGPAARQLDGSPFRVKLRLKEGVEPQGRRPYRSLRAIDPKWRKQLPSFWSSNSSSVLSVIILILCFWYPSHHCVMVVLVVYGLCGTDDRSTGP